jgi:hypothetical protein
MTERQTIVAKNGILIAKKDVETRDVIGKKDLIGTKDLLETKDSETSDDKRPKNLRANAIPTEGYGLEVDGKMKSQYATSDAAFTAGLALKKKFPLIQVKVFAAKEQTRALVELPKA